MSLSDGIRQLENFKKYAAREGCFEVEVCSGCGQEGCDSCPCGTSYKVVNRRADLAELILKKEFGVTDVAAFAKAKKYI